MVNFLVGQSEEIILKHLKIYFPNTLVIGLDPTKLT